ncbi:YesL family protein [Gracilibacillus sp. D59]|uniref:YesL family protein n=1 Tax=Gracilibacillus sp. D59 TaxID=3457434 RepID=UPI003FCCD192
MNSVKLTEIMRTFCITALKLTYLNTLWFLFMLLGFVLFGLGPATAALCKIQHSWLKEKDVSSIFSSFWKEYKLSFLKVNMLTIILIVLGAIIYFDLQFFMEKEGLWYRTISILIFIFSIWYMMVVLYVFPIYTHYQVKLFTTIRYAFIVAMLNPFKTIGMAVAAGGMLYLSLYFPQIMFSIGISLTFFIIMIMATHGIDQIKVLKERYSN